MKHPDHEPEEGLDTPSETPARKVARGVDPLSIANRRRLLRALSAAAQSGDVAAQAALIELSMGIETLRRLKAEGEDA